MEHMISAIYDRICPASALEWQQEWPGTISAGRYTIIADRHVPWENDLLVDGLWASKATTVDRLKQVAANLERRNG